jgi:signal transduction histidine kinase
MFRNLQIRSKLGAILVLPLVALIVFASLQVASSISRRSEANRTNSLTGVAARITSLTDSLQQERATSTGYVASNRGRFRPEMLQSRAKADKDTTALRDGLVDLNVSDYAPRLRNDVADATRRLDGLANWRTQLDGTDPPTVSTVENLYTELLSGLLAVIADIGNEPGSRSVKADIAALVELSRAKEAAAQGTSLLFAALIKGEFGPGDYQRFAALVGEESSSVARFESIASPAQQVQFDHLVAGAGNSSLSEVMRQAALAGPGEPPNLDPELWLSTMSSKLGEYLKVEQRVASDVAAAATSDRDAAVRQTVLTIAIIVLVVVLAVGLSLLLSNSMARPLYALEKSARDVAEHHLPGVVERLQRPDAQVDEAGIEAMAASGGVPVRSSDEIGRVAEAFNSVNEVAIRIAAEQAGLRSSIGAMFLNLARRSQRLVDRQLELIDELERDEADPDALENLFKLDHLATRMRRNAEDLIVLSGAEPPRRWSEPVPLPQVVRGAVAEVEDYQRIELLPIDDVGVVGHSVADVIHLLAELLENATSFSPPGTSVRVAGQPAATGYVVEVEDRGLGMSDEELLDANQRLANPPVVDFAVSRMLGLFVVGRLAQRYDIRVQLRHSWYGGVTALVLLPSALLTWSGMEGQERELPAPRPELVPPAAEGRPSTHPGTPIPVPPPVAQPARASTREELPREQPAAGGVRLSAAGSDGSAASSRDHPAIPEVDQPAATGDQRAATGQVAPGQDPFEQPAPQVTRAAAPAQPAPVLEPVASNGGRVPHGGEAGGRNADRLPIFEQARSDWFDSAGGSTRLPMRRPAPQPTPTRQAGQAARAHAEDKRAVPLPPSRPGPLGQGERAGGPGPGQPDPGQPLTRTGLPRRVPRANLAPGIAANPPPQQQPAAGQSRQVPRQVSRAARSPEDVRAMLSSYRSGLERGRRMAAGPDTLRYQPAGDDLDGPDGAEEQR